jgi:RNA polymerase sigma factor (sigma-70 family)
MDMTEESAFLDYKAVPTPERLTALLTAVQDRVYNICFQILRRPEDAEDACQEVLIEVTRGLASVDDPRPFKVWLYRVAVHTALDRKDSLNRHARLAQQVSISKPEGPPMNETERAELMRAIRALDDRTRCMVLEHYFDKMTLDEIGAREGISAPAVFKRLDRARETLRRAMLGAGITVAAAGVAEALESVTPVAAPAGIAGKALLAGGAVMGTKSAITGGTIVAALILIGAASTGGYLVGNARSDLQMREVQDKLARVDRPAPPPERNETEQTSEPIPDPVLPNATKPEKEEATPSPRIDKTKSRGQTQPEDPRRVFYGRAEKSDPKKLLDAESWDDFYRMAKEMRLRGETLEDMIFQRLGKELGFNAKTVDSLRTIFERERIETTRSIVENSGGPSTFRMKMDDEYGWNWNLFHVEWQRVRNNIRQSFNDEYLKHLTFDQLGVFNEHLRNTEIRLEASYGPEGTYYLIGGLGKPVK